MKNLFKTKQDALKFLRANPNLSEYPKNVFYFNGTYYLAYGEHTRPNYRPIRYADGWAIKVYYFYYNTIVNAPKDGRVSDEYFTNIFCLTDELCVI